MDKLKKLAAYVACFTLLAPCIGALFVWPMLCLLLYSDFLSLFSLLWICLDCAYSIWFVPALLTGLFAALIPFNRGMSYIATIAIVGGLMSIMTAYRVIEQGLLFDAKLIVTGMAGFISALILAYLLPELFYFTTESS